MLASSECVSGSVSSSVCFIAYGGMKLLQSQKAHGAPLYLDRESSAQLVVFALCSAFSFFSWYFARVNVPFLSTYGKSLCSHSDFHPSQRAICPSVT